MFENGSFERVEQAGHNLPGLKQVHGWPSWDVAYFVVRA